MAATFVEPSCHSYLGNQLRDARKKQPFNINPDATYTVLLVALPDVVLFPGETIPLRLQHQELVTRIEQIMQMSGVDVDDQQFIGVLSVLPGRHGRSTLASFGTTVEINSSHRARMESRQLHHDEENRQEMILTGKGKFRFRLQSVRTDGPGIMYGRATIFPEEVLPSGKLHPALNAFPRWVYAVNSPAVLAKRAYQLVESSLFWTVGN
jgi:Lon protease-like protein